MNKCVLCTFFKMVWNGLWNNTCPSVDKKKEEKPLGFKQTLLSIVLVIITAAVLLGVIVLIGKGLMWLLVWLFGKEIFEILKTIFVLVLLLVIVCALVYGIIQDVKVRIACIKAYWRKAKEACA